jgi:hypothetical protein
VTPALLLPLVCAALHRMARYAKAWLQVEMRRD